MKTTKTTAIYPGTFDPLTLGHLNIIERISRLFDEVVVLIAVNTSKEHLFTLEERVRLIEENIQRFSNVRIDTLSDGLVADYFVANDATTLVRGVRNSTDFDYEFTIASGNARQSDKVETVILYAADEYRFLSSSLIKEIAYYHGNIEAMVPKNVQIEMEKKYRR